MAIFNSEKENKSNQKPTVEEIVKPENNKSETYVVYTPVKEFNGEVAGVQFAYGKAEVKDGWVLQWFKEKGYKVEVK